MVLMILCFPLTFSSKIQEYLQTKEQQVTEYKKAKEEEQKARASIVARAIERIMKDQVSIFNLLSKLNETNMSYMCDYVLNSFYF